MVSLGVGGGAGLGIDFGLELGVGLALGLLTAGHQLGAAAGAGLGGYIFVRNSSYDLVWSSSIALAVIAALLVLIMRDEPKAIEVKAIDV